MEHPDFLQLSLIFLLAAVVIVPISKKLGLGAVLGYLVAGVIIGPSGLHWISDVQAIMHFSELGVVFLLFLIGLELEPKKLWKLRTSIFGMGSAQVVLCTAGLGALAWALGLPWNAALIAGMGFSLSSTAIAVQIFQERGVLSTQGGQAGFSILLFQDIAVIPMIALVPLLAFQSGAKGGAGWLGFFQTLGLLVLIGVVGRLLLRHLLRFMASVQVREVFTAFALLLVIGMATLMKELDLSMGLGAFLAGVLLADSEYRHALETDIEPFKGLLLGLFFMSVAMSIDFGFLLQSPLQTLLLVMGLLLVKTTLLLALARGFRLPRQQGFEFGLALSQVGEFAFVLFGAAQSLGTLRSETASILMGMTALSMMTTPIVMVAYDRWMVGRSKEVRPQDKVESEKSEVIIAGFGRFGQIVGRFLFANGIRSTVLDFEPDQIELLRKFGFKVYYGDATRLDLLEAAGISEAKVLVVAIDEVESNLKLIDLAQAHFPHLRIFARARNVQHYYELLDRKVDAIERETFESSLSLGVQVLRGLGLPHYQAVKASDRFRSHNLEMLREIHPIRKDEKTMISKAKQAREDLEKMFKEDEPLRDLTHDSWKN